MSDIHSTIGAPAGTSGNGIDIECLPVGAIRSGDDAIARSKLGNGAGGIECIVAERSLLLTTLVGVASIRSLSSSANKLSNSSYRT